MLPMEPRTMPCSAVFGWMWVCQSVREIETARKTARATIIVDVSDSFMWCVIKAAPKVSRARNHAPSYFRRCGRKIQKLTSAAQKLPVSCDRM